MKKIAIALILCLSACNDTPITKCNVSEVIHIGMTPEQVIAVCGKPRHVNADSYGIEQWVYSLSTYVYLENGKVRSWQWSYQK